MDVGSAILAATGIVTGIGALYVNYRSQRDQNRQQAAASSIAEKAGRVDEVIKSNEVLSGMNDRLVTQLTDARMQVDTLRERNDMLENEVDEQKELRRQMLSRQAARCEEVQAMLTDTVLTLRDVVQDEIAKTAAGVVLGTAGPHPHDDGLVSKGREHGVEGDKDGERSSVD